MNVLEYQIKKCVSGGLGFDSKTDFSDSRCVGSDMIDLDNVKNSQEGLAAHLYGLWKIGEEDKDIVLYRKSGKIGKGLVVVGRVHRDIKYEGKIRKAVRAEVDRCGGVGKLVKGKVLDGAFEYIMIQDL